MVKMKKCDPRDCIFCKIIAGELNAEFIYKNKDFVVFRSIANESPTHLLIVPTKHYITSEDMVNQELNKMSDIFKIAKDIAEKYHLEGYKLNCNIGSKGGQEVPHLHMHLLSESELVLN